jgi:hypothetical protein
VLGIGGKTVDTGETFGEGGEFEKVLTVEDVDGLSLPRLWALDWRNALWIRGLPLAGPVTVPNDVEFRPTYVCTVEGCALGVKTLGFSEQKVSYGNASTAYAGGPVGTP